MKNETRSLRSWTCPSCKAPLKADGSQRTVQCSYCHASVEVPQDNKQTVIIVQPESHPVQAAWYKAYQKNAGKYSLIWVGVVVVLAIIGGISSHFSTRTTPRLSPYRPGGNGVRSPDALLAFAHRPPLRLGKTDNHPAQVFFLSRTIGSEKNQEYILTAAEADSLKTRWHVAGIEDKSVDWTGDDQYVYLASKTRFLIIDRSKGTVLERSLQDEVPGGQGSGILAFPEQVVVLSKDGSLQGFSKKDGARLWTKRLNKTPDEIFARAGLVGVIDEIHKKYSALLIDPRTGEDAGQVAPTGPNSVFSFPQQIEPYHTHVLLEESDQSVYFVFGYYPPFSIQRWDIASKTKLWSTAVDLEEHVITRLPFAPVQTSTLVFFGSEKKIVGVEKKTGRVAFSFKDTAGTHKLSALGEKEGILLVRAERNKGTSRDELWAIDIASGKELWQVTLDPEYKIEGGSGQAIPWSGFHKKGAFYGISARGVTLLLLSPEDKQATLQTYAWRTGVGGSKTAVDWPWGKNPSILKWTPDDKLWLSTYHGLGRIDVGTWKTEASWP